VKLPVIEPRLESIEKFLPTIQHRLQLSVAFGRHFPNARRLRLCVDHIVYDVHIACHCQRASAGCQRQQYSLGIGVAYEYHYAVRAGL